MFHESQFQPGTVIRGTLIKIGMEVFRLHCPHYLDFFFCFIPVAT